MAPTRILLLEDDLAYARLVREQLGPEFVVVHADRLTEAERLAATQSFDCALVDLNLPDAHGLEVVTRLRQIAAATAIVVLTGSADKPMAARCIASGAEDVVMKGRESGQLLRFALRFALRCASQRVRPQALVHA